MSPPRGPAPQALLSASSEPRPVSVSGWGDDEATLGGSALPSPGAQALAEGGRGAQGQTHFDAQGQAHGGGGAQGKGGSGADGGGGACLGSPTRSSYPSSPRRGVSSLVDSGLSPSPRRYENPPLPPAPFTPGAKRELDMTLSALDKPPCERVSSADSSHLAAYLMASPSPQRRAGVAKLEATELVLGGSIVRFEHQPSQREEAATDSPDGWLSGWAAAGHANHTLRRPPAHGGGGAGAQSGGLPPSGPPGAAASAAAAALMRPPPYLHAVAPGETVLYSSAPSSREESRAAFALAGAHTALNDAPDLETEAEATVSLSDVCPPPSVELRLYTLYAEDEEAEIKLQAAHARSRGHTHNLRLPPDRDVQFGQPGGAGAGALGRGAPPPPAHPSERGVPVALSRLLADPRWQLQRAKQQQRHFEENRLAAREALGSRSATRGTDRSGMGGSRLTSRGTSRGGTAASRVTTATSVRTQSRGGGMSRGTRGRLFELGATTPPTTPGGASMARLVHGRRTSVHFAEDGSLMPLPPPPLAKAVASRYLRSVRTNRDAYHTPAGRVGGGSTKPPASKVLDVYL